MLSRRDQHLGSWGRSYAFPLCTSISGQVIPSYQPANLITNLLNHAAAKRQQHVQQTEYAKQLRGSAFADILLRALTGGQVEAGITNDCRLCRGLVVVSWPVRQDACRNNVSYLAITPSGNSEPFKVPTRAWGHGYWKPRLKF
jgi:hypothetical protein